MGYVNWLDVLICTIIFLSTLISIVRGFIKECLSLVSWVLAFYLAYRFFEDLANAMSGIIGHAAFRASLAFVIIFIVSVIVLSILTYAISKLISISGLKGFDRIFGAAFGVARGLLIVNLLLITGGMLSLTSYVWWKQSLLVGKFTPQVVWLKENLPEFNKRFQLYVKRDEALQVQSEVV